MMAGPMRSRCAVSSTASIRRCAARSRVTSSPYPLPLASAASFTASDWKYCAAAV